jgi:hypothetical protein
MRLLLVGLLLNSLLLSPAPASQSSLAPVPDSPKGFDQQYRKFIDYYWKGKEQQRAAKFDYFALPSHWFAERFGAEQGKVLALQYSKRFEDFKSSGAGRLKGTEPCASCVLILKTRLLEKVNVKLDSGDLLEVQRFEIDYATQFLDDNLQPRVWSGHTTWTESFIYVDGSFRFYANEGLTR